MSTLGRVLILTRQAQEGEKGKWGFHRRSWLELGEVKIGDLGGERGDVGVVKRGEELSYRILF